jgi:hypothetical protein
MFCTKPGEYKSPLEKGDHPEIDCSDELDDAGVKIYLSIIGSLQWAISLGRFDMKKATMTMSRFRISPRKGHLERLKYMNGYLRRFNSAAIRVRWITWLLINTIQEFDWATSVYWNVEEDIVKDIPEALGKTVLTVHYLDANLYHVLNTGRSVTGILSFYNQTLVDWLSKRQACVQTATFCSEFVAAHITVDQIIDLRATFRCFGVPIQVRGFKIGENQAVVNNIAMTHSFLSKRHNALSYHRVREGIGAKVVNFFWVNGKHNPADIVSKLWAYPQIWHILQPILCASGDTGRLTEKEESECKKIWKVKKVSVSISRPASPN